MLHRSNISLVTKGENGFALQTGANEFIKLRQVCTQPYRHVIRAPLVAFGIVGEGSWLDASGEGESGGILIGRTGESVICC